MIKLKVENAYLEVSGKLQFNITFRSPVFGFLTNIVYNFSIPYTDFNARLFGFPLHLNRLNRAKVNKPGSIEIENIVINGTWAAKESAEDYIELSFSFIADEFTAFAINKNLPELFDEIITTTNIFTHQYETIQKTWPETNYQFPSVFNPDFYGDKNESFLGVINYFEHFYVNKDTNGNTIIPMPYLAFIVKEIFIKAGYEVNGSIFNDAMFKTAILYSNFALDKLVTEYYKGYLFDFTTPSYLGYYIIICDIDIENVGNRYNVITGKYELTRECNYETSATIIHKPTSTLEDVDYVIQLIHTNIDLEDEIVTQVTGRFLAGSSNLITTTIIDSHSVLEDELGFMFIRIRYTDEHSHNVSINIAEAVVEIVSTASPCANIFQNEFNLKNHVPDISVLDFLDKVYQQFQIFPVFNNISKTVTLLHFSEIISKVQDSNLSQGLIRNTLKVDQNQFDGFEMAFTFTGSDSAISSQVPPKTVNYNVLKWPTWFEWAAQTSNLITYVEVLNAWFTHFYDYEFLVYNYPNVADNQVLYKIGNGVEKIKFDFSPAVMRNFLNSKGNNIIMPAVISSGTSEAYQLLNEAPLRILFYSGYNVGVSSIVDAYPYATTTKYDSLGNTVFPITWTAQEVALRYWSETITWYRNRLKLEFTRYFTSKELFELSLHQKQMFQDAHILIEEAFAVIDNDLKEVQVKGYTA